VPRSATARTVGVLLCVLLLASGCGGDGDAGQDGPTVVPTSNAVVPEGWTVQRSAGFSVATPPEWLPRDAEVRFAPEAALEIGVPVTGQPVALPLLIGFVERERVGPLDVRESLLRLQLEQGLPEGATFGAAEHVEVAGAVDALFFDAVYATQAGTSVLGTPLPPITVRQRELIVDTPGLPKYGFRFTVPVDDFDEQLWDRLLGSLVVSAGEDATGDVPA
jgi:hypothetical protein